jgi:hypothetical protein
MRVLGSQKEGLECFLRMSEYLTLRQETFRDGIAPVPARRTSHWSASVTIVECESVPEAAATVTV